MSVSLQNRGGGGKEFSRRHFATFSGCSSVEFAGSITHCHCSPFATIYTGAEVHISCNALCLTSEWEMLWNVHRREDGLKGSFQRRGRVGVTGARCLFSPPDVREVGQFVCPVHDPMCPFGTVGPSFHPGMGVRVALGTSLSLGCSRALPGVRLRVGQDVPAASGGFASFSQLLLGAQDGITVHG